MLPDGIAEIISLLVLPAYRRQGIGTRLVAALEEELIKNGCTQIQISYRVTESNTFALELLLQKLAWTFPQTFDGEAVRQSCKVLEIKF